MGNLSQYLNGQKFTASEVKTDSFELIPDGTEAPAMIMSSSTKSTKSGEAIVLEVELVDGSYKGRKFNEWLNVMNSSEKAVEIAYQTLAKITKAVNKDTIEDSSELHNIRFTAVIGVQQPKEGDTYKDKDGNVKPSQPQNRIKAYKVYGGSAAQSSNASDVSSEPKKMAWQK